MDENEVKVEENVVPETPVVETKATEQASSGKVVESKGMSIAALILGIVSVCTLCVKWLPTICAILAIIFGAIGRKRGARGMGTAGMVLGIVTLAIYALLLIFGAGVGILALLGLAAAT